MDLNSLKQLGKEKFGKFCLMCRICDGRACAGQIPGMGGVSTASAFTNNLKALSNVSLRQRIIHEACEPDTSCEFFGVKMAAPILAAPIGGISFNLNDFTPEIEYAKSIVGGSCLADCLAMTGDGGISEIYDSGIEAVKLASGRGIPTIKPRANDVIIQMAKRAIDAGAVAVAVDVDSAALINMKRFNQPVGPKSFAQLKELVESIDRPLIIKGVLTLEDAKACYEAGVDSIVVSNHGGRVLDYATASAKALPEIAHLYKGKMKIFVDGGVRTGTDVLKMLALGADAVLIGRPIMQSAVGGAEGVKIKMESFIQELKLAMIMTGMSAMRDIDGSIISK